MGNISKTVDEGTFLSRTKDETRRPERRCYNFNPRQSHNNETLEKRSSLTPTSSSNSTSQLRAVGCEMRAADSDEPLSLSLPLLPCLCPLPLSCPLSCPLLRRSAQTGAKFYFSGESGHPARLGVLRAAGPGAMLAPAAAAACRHKTCRRDD